MSKTPREPRKRDPQRSRETLLQAAIEEFSERGPQAARIDAICERADLNKRLAYHYFGGKDGLYKEALSTVYKKFLELEIELSSMLLPAEELLEVLVRRYYEFLRDHPEFVRLLSYENLNNGQTANSLSLMGLKAPVITALQLAIEKGQNEGRFRKGIDVTQLLISIFGLSFFYFSNRTTLQQILGQDALSDENLDNRIHHVVNLLLNGISK